MKYASLDLGTIEAVVNKLGGMDGVGRFLRGEISVGGVQTGNVFPLAVNYSLSVEEMIAAGKYDWVNSDITHKHFPHDRDWGTENVAVELIHYNRTMSSDEVLADLDRNGLRPATLPELLALGEKHPDLQREFPIVALGSVWQNPRGYRRVACLHGGDAGRGLYLGWVGGDWDELCRFAAVHK